MLKLEKKVGGGVLSLHIDDPNSQHVTETACTALSAFQILMPKTKKIVSKSLTLQ